MDRLFWRAGFNIELILEGNADMSENRLFHEMESISSRPGPFEVYTARDLWTDEHIAEQMLQFHLHPEIDAASVYTGPKRTPIPEESGQ
ncbi:hypothetical protein [Spirochaeta dissipatitropha]